MYVPAKKVVIHHTATSNTYTDGAAEVRAIYTYHTRTLGWGDIGYNALVDKYGNIYEGRHGRGEGAGREILSADVVAGHTLSTTTAAWASRPSVTTSRPNRPRR